MKNTINTKNNGFSLIELMIAILIGLILSAAILQTFMSSVRSNSEYLRIVNMNQELRATMNFVARELKNAGAWVKANNDITTANPFAANISIDDAATPVPFNSVQGDCIKYIFDNEADETLNTNDHAGFKYVNTVGVANRVLLYKRTSALASYGTMCVDGGWQGITDTNSVIIYDVDFDLRANEAQDEAPTFYDVIVTISGATKLRGNNDDYVAADLNDKLNTYTKEITRTIRIRNY